MKLLIYKLTAPNGKCYIGWTKRTLRERLNDHRSAAKRGFTFKIYNAIRKYPLEQWQKEILFETNNMEESRIKEKEFIKKYNSIVDGYNTSIGGEYGSLGCKKTKEQCLKLSERMKQTHREGKFDYKAHSLKMKGHVVSNEQKQKVANTLAHSYMIITPSGNIEYIKNLNKYADEHNLDRGNMHSVATNRLKQYKGYIVRNINS